MPFLSYPLPSFPVRSIPIQSLYQNLQSKTIDTFSYRRCFLAQKRGYNSTLSFGGTNVGNIVDVISGPASSRNMIPVTVLTDAHEKYEPGLITGGEITVKLLLDWDSTTQTFLKDAFEDQTDSSALVITYPDGTAQMTGITGYVSGIGSEIPLDDKMSMDVTFTIEDAGWS